MPQIQVKKDNTLEQSNIVVGLLSQSLNEMGDDYEGNITEIQQSRVYGIQAPLIAINNIAIDFYDIESFSLSMNDRLPTVHVVVKDRGNLLTTFDTPGLDNELRVQILPKFEGKYKKINLTFYISSINIQEGKIRASGIYKCPKFTSDHIKSFGEISTYQLVENISNETGLGFASNVELFEDDKRFIYCNNKSYQDLLDGEIMAASNQDRVLDYWIDWWNNIVLCDIKDRYMNDDPHEDLKIWTSTINNEVEEGPDSEPMEIAATLTNYPALRSTELYVVSYTIKKSAGEQLVLGTDKVYSIYDNEKKEYLDHLIQDGDVLNDIFTKMYYSGENYGPYNYILSKIEYQGFLQKMQTNENIVVHLKTPLLGIMKGNRINFKWFIIDQRYENMKESLIEAGVVGNVDELTGGQGEPDPDFTVSEDISISGQYLITGGKITYRMGEGWDYSINLSRPLSSKNQIIKEETI